MSEWISVIDLPDYPEESASGLEILLISPDGSEQAFRSNVFTLAPQFTGGENYWSYMNASMLEIAPLTGGTYNQYPARLESPGTLTNLTQVDYNAVEVGGKLTLQWLGISYDYTIVSKQYNIQYSLTLSPPRPPDIVPIQQQFGTWYFTSRRFNLQSDIVNTSASLFSNSVNATEIKTDYININEEIKGTIGNNTTIISADVLTNNGINVLSQKILPFEDGVLKSNSIESCPNLNTNTHITIPYEGGKKDMFSFHGAHTKNMTIHSSSTSSKNNIVVENAPFLDFTSSMSPSSPEGILDARYKYYFRPYPLSQRRWGMIHYENDGENEGFVNDYSNGQFSVSGYVNLWNYADPIYGQYIPIGAFLVVSIEVKPALAGQYIAYYTNSSVAITKAKGTAKVPQVRANIGVNFGGTVYVEYGGRVRVSLQIHPDVYVSGQYFRLQDARDIVASRNVENRLQISYLKSSN